MKYFKTSQPVIAYTFYLPLLMVIGITLFFSACSKEEEVVEQTALFVDASIAPYFARFKQEGEARGVEVDLTESKIEGYLTTLASGVIGQCTYDPDSNTPKQVKINARYWSTASDLMKEMVVFHELGHCFLNRKHDDSVNSDGTCSSVMHSGLLPCRMLYTKNTRSSYLDELFD